MNEGLNWGQRCSTSQQSLQNHSGRREISPEAGPGLPASLFPSCRILPLCFKAGGRIQRFNQCLQQRQSEADTGWMWGAQGSAATGTLPSCALNGNLTGRSSNTNVILPHEHISWGVGGGKGGEGGLWACRIRPRPPNHGHRRLGTNGFQLRIVLVFLLTMFIPRAVQMCSAKTPRWLSECH